MRRSAKRFLLVGGLGHTDLSGKVPRPGLLLLRRALRGAGHDAVVLNYALSLGPRLFPPPVVKSLSKRYHRSIKPIVVDGVDPLHSPLSYARLPLDMRGLVRTTRWLQENERRVLAQVGRELSEKVKTDGFDAVGFSLYVGSSTIGAILMANRLRKEHPHLPIFFGGPQTTHFAETIYRKTQAPTALVVGEGEIAIVRLAQVLDELVTGKTTALAHIPNLVFRTVDGQLKTTTRERLTRQEWIALSKDVYEREDFDGVLRYAFIEASRGCIYGCRFCPQPLLSGKERYLKTGDQIVDEMEGLYHRFGIHHFELVGSSTPPAQAEAIADALCRRKKTHLFKWGLFMRGKDETAVQQNLPELMGQLRRTGAHAIFFGVESASNQTLEKMGKGERLEEIKAAMIAARDSGIATIGSFIYPYPGMLSDEGDRIIAFLQEVLPVSAPAQPLGLYPGTYCARFAKEIGVQIQYPDKRDQAAWKQGKKPAPTMESPEVLSYLLTYPLILSLPMRFWPPLPWKIDGMDYRQTVKAVNSLQREMGKLGIQTGLSHSHVLLAGVLGWTLPEMAERLFYCSITGDPETTREILDRFNERSAVTVDYGSNTP